MKSLIRISTIFLFLSTILNTAQAALNTNKWYFIESKINRLHLDVQMGNKAAKTPVWMFTPNGSQAQQWMLQDAGGGYFYIKSRLSGMYLDVKLGSKAAKAIVWQYPKNGSDAQKWKAVSAGGGYWYFKSKRSGLYLDVKGGGMVKRTMVWQYPLNKSNAQKWKMKPVSRENVRDHRSTAGNTSKTNRPTPRPAQDISDRINLPDNFRPSFEDIPVWRLQLRVKTSNIKNANTDDAVYVQFRNNTSSIYYLDNGGDDREKHKTDTYDILDSNIKTIRDIQFLKLVIKGKNGWCIQKIELLVNGERTPVFQKSFGTCRWLDRDGGRSPALVVSGSSLRQSPSWRHTSTNRAIWLPPSIIKRSSLEKMVESYVGHMMKTNPQMKEMAYGFKNGRSYVEAKRIAGNKLHFDLDLKYENIIDLETDVDFNLAIKCQNNKINLKAESVKAQVDIPLVSTLVRIFEQGFMKMDMGNFEFGNANVPMCPSIKVTPEGDISMRI